MIKATIVLLVAHALIPGLRRRSAAERHLVWVGTLGIAALLPVLTLLVPSWQPDWIRRMADIVPASLAAIQPWARGSNADIVVRATGIEPAVWTLDATVMWLWAVGAAAALLALAVEVARLTRLVSASRCVSDERWLAAARDVADALLLSHSPQLLHCGRASVPIAWGVRRPRILLPADALEWSDDRRRAVLAHELAHIRRGDWVVHVLVELTAAIYWFHPLFWTARNRLRRESEQAADDVALALGTSGTEYAAHLIAIVRAARTPVRAWTASVAMARPSHLEARVAALLDAGANRASVDRRMAMAAAVIAAATAVPLAAMRTPAASVEIEFRTSDLLPAEFPWNAGPAGALPAAPTVRLVGANASRVDALVAPEIVEYTTPPLYSDTARRRGVEGVVTVRARIDERGRIDGMRVVRGVGFGLDQNALVAARQWRFRPAMRDGTPVAMETELEIVFSLRNEAINALIANDMATLMGPGVAPPTAVRVIELPPPAPNARGTVLLDVVLPEDGIPKIVRILKSLSPELDESAIRTFEQWRFSPALKDGRPIKVRMIAEVNFHG